MKKIKFITSLIIVVILANYKNTLAENIYYTNSHGVNFSEKQYNYFSKMFWEGYQDIVTQEEFNYIDKLDLFNSNIETKYSVLPIPSLTEKSRTLIMNKSCSSQCYISLQATWNSNPTIKSYDVIGARLKNVSLVKVGKAYVIGTNYTQSYSVPEIKDNGFGYSVKLENVNNLKVNVSFYTTTGGNIYGAYEHAKTNISLENSRLYTIGQGGQGNVFNFYGAASSVYDNANGLEIEV